MKIIKVELRGDIGFYSEEAYKEFTLIMSTGDFHVHKATIASHEEVPTVITHFFIKSGFYDMKYKYQKQKQALLKERALTTSPEEFQRLTQELNKPYLVVDNTGLKLYLRRGKKSFAESQFDLYIKNKSKGL